MDDGKPRDEHRERTLADLARQRGARAAFEDERGRRQRLLAAAESGDPELLASALADGCDPMGEAPGFAGELVLHVALRERLQRAALALIPLSDCARLDAKGWSPLSLAAREGLLDALRAMLERPEVRADQAELDDALRCAAERDRPEALLLLLPWGDPLALSPSSDFAWQGDGSGWSALTLAAHAGSRACCEILAPLGGLDSRGPGGETCWELARARGHRELASWLEGVAQARRDERALAEALGSDRDGDARHPGHAGHAGERTRL